MLISPECTNCTKAISEGKADPHTHQFLQCRWEESERPADFLCYCSSSSGLAADQSSCICQAATRISISMIPACLPGQERAKSHPLLPVCPFSLLTQLLTGDGVERHYSVSFPGQSSPSPGQHSAASGMWRFNFWSSPHPSLQLDTAAKQTMGWIVVCAATLNYITHITRGGDIFPSTSVSVLQLLLTGNLHYIATVNFQLLTVSALHKCSLHYKNNWLLKTGQGTIKES